MLPMPLPVRRMPIAVEAFGVGIAVDLEARRADRPRGALQMRPQAPIRSAPLGRDEEHPESPRPAAELRSRGSTLPSITKVGSSAMSAHERELGAKASMNGVVAPGRLRARARLVRRGRRGAPDARGGDLGVRAVNGAGTACCRT